MKRTPAAILMLLLTFGLTLSVLDANGGLPDGPSTGGLAQGPDFEGTRIALVLPEVSLKEVRLSGSIWTLPYLERAIYPPTSGGPSVPVMVKRLELSNDVKDIRIVRSGPVTFRLPYPIPPSYSPMMVGSEGWDDTSTLELVVDEDIYSSMGPFPERPVSWSHLGYGWENGTRHSSYAVTYAPMDYDPSGNELTVYSEIELVIEEEGTPSRQIIAPPSRVDPPATYERGTELLIISHDPFIDDLGDYIEWKREKGTSITVVGYSAVNSAYPTLDGPASIWSYIRDSYFGDGQTLRWVLLAGEPRFVPTRMVYDLDPYYGEPQYLTADTYYSCLDGSHTNWDSDGDGKWAEMGDISDIEPEVYVSRISLDSEVEAQGWARKVVSYEKTPPAGTWSGTAAFFGSTTHVSDDGPTESEDLWDLYLDRVHTDLDRYYSQGPTQQNTGAKLLNYGNIQEGLTSGFSTLNYMGHGHYAVWSEGTQEDNTIIYTVNEASSLSNGARLPLIFAMSCETNWFDDSGFDSISEEFTENAGGGALAYLGAVRTTEGGIGFTPHQYTPGAPGIQEDVLRMIASGKRSVAEIMLEAKEYYFTQWSSYFYYYQFAYNAWVEHSVLGPPDTEIWTAAPKTLNVAHTHENDRYSNFTVAVTDSQGKAVQDALVCVRSAEIDATSKALTDQYGKAVIPFEITDTSDGKLTVTRSGFRPFQTGLVLTDNTPPKVTLVKGIPNPDGASGWYVHDPLLSLTSSEPCDLRYRWNGGEDQRYSEAIDAMKGENTLEWWGKDPFGNTGPISKTVIMYDPDPPAVAVVQTPAVPDGKSGWYITTPVIELTMPGGQGSEQKLEVWLDLSVKQIYSTPIHVPDGEHELHILATDKAGNRAPQIDIDFKVDTMAPTTTFSTGGIERNDNGFYTEPMKITLRTEDPGARTYYRWDEDPSWELYSTPLDPLTGIHSLNYRSEDPRGNQEQVRTELVPYDLSPPVLRYTITPQQPSGSNGWYIKAPVISLSGEDDTGNYTIKYRMDGAEQDYERPITLPEGITTLRASITDMAGNEGEDLELTIKVDSTVDRTTPYTDASPNSEGWYLDTPMVTLRTDGRANVFYRFLGYGDFMKYSGAFLPPSDEGSYQLEYYSVDEAGNKEAVRTLFLSIDSRAPVVSVTGPSSVSSGERVDFDLSTSTDGIGIEEYYFDPGDGSKGGWDSSPEFSHVYSKGGKYTITFKARDAAGHESTPYEMEIMVEEDGTLIYLIIGGGVGVALLAGMLLLALAASRRHHPHPHLQHHPRAPHHGHPPHQMRPHPQIPPRTPAGTRPPIPPNAAPRVPGPPAAGLIAPTTGLPPRLPGPMQGMTGKGVELGKGAVTPIQGKLDQTMDKHVDHGKGRTDGPLKAAPMRGTPPPPQRPVNIPEPPRPPTF